MVGLGPYRVGLEADLEARHIGFIKTNSKTAPGPSFHIHVTPPSDPVTKRVPPRKPSKLSRSVEKNRVGGKLIGAAKWKAPGPNLFQHKIRKPLANGH